MLKLECMPQATQKNFARLQDDPRTSCFTLVGGTALALQLGHRVSEDLDLNIFGQKLPVRAIEGILQNLASCGARIESLITPEQKTQFKINTSDNLDDYVQDYWIDGAKVTFHSRNENDRPPKQIEFLKSTPKLDVSEHGFKVLGTDGLFMMKSIVIYDRVKSRDLYDLMVLIRDHGFTLNDAFSAIEAYQPARHKNPEHFKSVVTGLIPLDPKDEGFSSIQLDVKMSDVYRYFRQSINDHEVALTQAMARTSLKKPS